VSFPEDRRVDREGLTDGRLGRLSPEIDQRHHLEDGYASDHSPTLANATKRRKSLVSNRATGDGMRQVTPARQEIGSFKRER
jgi:hypothetical protein